MLVIAFLILSLMCTLFHKAATRSPACTLQSSGVSVSALATMGEDDEEAKPAPVVERNHVVNMIKTDMPEVPVPHLRLAR